VVSRGQGVVQPPRDAFGAHASRFAAGGVLNSGASSPGPQLSFPLLRRTIGAQAGEKGAAASRLLAPS